MAWHALSLLINQLQASMRTGMQMHINAKGPISLRFSNLSGLLLRFPVTYL